MRIFPAISKNDIVLICHRREYWRSLDFTTFGGLSDFFFNRSHSYHYDPENGVIMDLLENQIQNDYMRPFIETIRIRSITSDEQAKIAISLVQRIPDNGNRYARNYDGMVLSL